MAVTGWLSSDDCHRMVVIRWLSSDGCHNMAVAIWLFSFVYIEHNFLVWKTMALQVLSHHILEFLGSRRMETAPTSIEVLLRSNLVQSDEPSDLRGSLSLTIRHRCTHVLYCIQHLAVPGRHPFNYEPGTTLLNFSDRDNTDELTPYSVIWLLPYGCHQMAVTR